jgi:tripartite-type tricarboxylate transporter receptor subunit TctC
MRRASILRAAWVAALLPAALLPAARGPAAAETYPARPITLVVPFAPGGSASTVARSVADKMSETLGQQIVIDNRGGAGGTLATRAVAKGAPDGYTILVVTSATVGTSPSLLHNLGYDPRKDLDPIGLIAATPNVIVVHPSFPARSLAELIKIGKETATPIPYGSPGTGTLNHLTVELLAYRTGMKLSHVPYKGAAPALNDLLGGHIGVLISAIPNAHSHIVAGTIRGLAVTGAKRSPLIPAVPTFAGGWTCRLRRAAAMGPRRARGHAAPCHRHAQPGAQRCADDRRGAWAPCHRRRRAAAHHARGVCRHHRRRADDVVRPGESRRHQPGMKDHG